MRYPQKTSTAHNSYVISKHKYRFDKLEIASRSTLSKYWDEHAQRWVRRIKAITHGVNQESEETNSHQHSVDSEAGLVKGYDAFDFMHW